ncbi:MAG TPA: hypothetical protein VEC16_05330 [Alphaproteobacteria bacterium]|nr:hypothetical protein [Alphaproteobacteria bacterium]
MNKKLKLVLAAGAIACALTPLMEYSDLPALTKGPSAGRTKNSIAALVSGIVGKKLYNSSTIDVNVEKSFWPDSRIIGETTNNQIHTYNNLTFTSSKFDAEVNSQGLLEGKVDKSEFDWEIKQINDSTYHIGRFGLKLDTELKIKMADGKIKGEYLRPDLNFDWNIKGTYDKRGNVNIEIDGPLTLGITLKGEIRNQKGALPL